MTPIVTVHRQFRGSGVDKPWLERASRVAVPLIQEHLKGDAPPLATLAEISAIIISDSQIAKLHKRFLNDSRPTDVITFHHGEIFISRDTARRVGPEHGNDEDKELCLYMIHGLLHLAGWDDHEPEEAEAMKGIQESILKAVCKRVLRD